MQRNTRQQKPRANGMIQLGLSVHTLQHQPARIKAHDNQVIALLPEFPAQQFAMSGGSLPVDEARIHARRKFAQSFEFRSLAARTLDF